jgi:hypothetical protein
MAPPMIAVWPKSRFEAIKRGGRTKTNNRHFQGICQRTGVISFYPEEIDELIDRNRGWTSQTLKKRHQLKIYASHRPSGLDPYQVDFLPSQIKPEFFQPR